MLFLQLLMAPGPESPKSQSFSPKPNLIQNFLCFFIRFPLKGGFLSYTNPKLSYPMDFCRRMKKGRV